MRILATTSRSLGTIGLLAALLAWFLFGCAGAVPGDRGDNLAGALADLPELSGLDELPGAALAASAVAGYGGATSYSRHTSEVVSRTLPIDVPLLEQHTSFSDGTLTFNHQPDALAWAIFRIDPPRGLGQETMLDLFAAGDGKAPGLWLLVADYGTGSWTEATEFDGGAAQLDLGGSGHLYSPLGHLYCALVVPSFLAGGGPPAELTGLALRWDDATAPDQVYYVAPPPLGDNANDGSEGAPWATLHFAADAIGPGDRVEVLPGAYQGFMLQQSGTPDNPVVFNAHPGAEITSDNPTTPDGINIESWGGTPVHDVVVQGFTVSGATRAGIRIAGDDPTPAQNITVRYNTCQYNGKWGILSGFVDDLVVEGNVCRGSIEEHGIYLSNSGDRNVARFNLCYENSASGIQYNADASLGGDGTMSDGVLEYNVCFGNGTLGGAALNLDGVADTVIRGNLLYDNAASGLVLYNGDGVGSQRNTVLNNTILQPSNGRWCVVIGGSPDNVLRNNILLSDHEFRGAIEIDSLSAASLDSDYNILIPRFNVDDGGVIDLASWQATYQQDANSAVYASAELFRDPDTYDYRPASGGPAVDFGVTDVLQPLLDIFHAPRPQGGSIDAGAFEYAE